ncbi:50S ribosomal protein L4 [Candidatus Profftella armatura (Diaphorina cf. continua)]|uniref:Large ribosomal subunit protein uL4 n=1 Tax=Candidatus Profftella armatura (Diaphorina cf. continua) TaxID=2661583 RepID=A0A7R6VZM2_9PROT|nr:50S ribosomal protein L4 [Candidatus Profftella armatura (Diaphorina cf. continua)]BCG49449.1 50S ribosomal protein L4 [Candidatus Profftella armatura (Diaphorina cf. continua)]
MELKFLNAQGQIFSNIEVKDSIFNSIYNQALIHQIIVSYRANMRSGNRKQKDRKEVHHTTKKPWRQKGTGRARAGMSSSPLWRGGGRCFPNLPNENFSHKINKKMYRIALCSILSQLVRENRLLIIESFSIDSPKTKLLVNKLINMGLNSVLIIVNEFNKNLLLSSRNLSNVLLIEPRYINPISLIFYKKVLITRNALEKVERLLI